MEFEPVEALLANWQTIGGQEQRTNRVVTLKIEVRDRINSASAITVEGRIEPTLSQLLSSRDVLREQNSIAPEPTIMVLDLSEAIAPITASVHRIVSQTQLNLLKRCKFRLSYRSQYRTTRCADWVSLLRSAASHNSAREVPGFERNGAA